MSQRIEVSNVISALQKDPNIITISPEMRVLAGGRQSCLFVDIGDYVASIPEIKALIVRAFVQKFHDLEMTVDRIIGVPEGMNTITSSISDQLEIGQLRVEEKPTAEWQGTYIEQERSILGNFEPGMTVAIFEDVLTSGKSTKTRTLDPLEKAGLVPAVVITLLDRQFRRGLQDFITTDGGIRVPIYSFLTLTSMAEDIIPQFNPTDPKIQLLNQELAELKALQQ